MESPNSQSRLLRNLECQIQRFLNLALPHRPDLETQVPRTAEQIHRRFESLQGSSQMAYTNSLRIWLDWCEHDPATFPLSEEWLTQFVRHCLMHKSPNSTRAIVSAISSVLRKLSFAHLDYSSLLLDLAKLVPQHCVTERSRVGLPQNLIAAIRMHKDPEDLHDVRDAAILALIVATGARPREILGRFLDRIWEIPPVNVEDFQMNRDGSARLRLQPNVRHGGRVQVHVCAAAAQLVQDWLDKSGVKTGPMFRAFRSAEACGPAARPYKPHHVDCLVNNYVKRFAKGSKPFSARDLRKHLATQLIKTGLHLVDVQLAMRTTDEAAVTRMHQVEKIGGRATEVLRQFELVTAKRRSKFKKKDSEPSPQGELFARNAA